MPFFSIVIPCYNRSVSLTHSILSVLNQVFQDWELTIVDDGSIDETRKIVSSFLKDSRVFYLFQENKGVTSARNLGASLSRGEWLIFLDSDDIVRESWLMNFKNAINDFSGYQVFQMGYELIFAGSGKREVFLPQRGKYLPPLTGTFAIKKDLFFSVGGYDEALKFGENSELFIRLEKMNIPIQKIEAADLIYQESPDGGSKNLLNMNDSIHHTLTKHQDFLSSRVKRLYHQIAGVNSMRMGNYKQASQDLREAFLFQPWKMDTLIRWGISKFPILARKIYPIKSSLDG